MNLRYINIGLDYDTYIEKNNDLRYSFQLSTRFISNFLSREIRKFKFQTDGTFNMISVSLLEERLMDTRIVASNVLECYVLFDPSKYNNVKGTNNCKYYLDLYKEGFIKASEFKSVPLDLLLKLLKEFEENQCKNEWLHKKSKFKNHNLEVELLCEFTTDYFQLVIAITQLSTKEKIVRQPIMKTEPDEVLFDKMFKDILIDKNRLIITDKSDSPRITIDIDSLYSGKLEYEVQGDKELKKILSYKL